MQYSELDFCINRHSDVPTILKHGPNMLQQFFKVVAYLQARHSGNHDHGSGNCPKTHSSQVKFQGACEVLKGHVFDCSDHCQADKYATTLKKLLEHVRAMFKNGGDV